MAVHGVDEREQAENKSALEQVFCACGDCFKVKLQIGRDGREAWSTYILNSNVNEFRILREGCELKSLVNVGWYHPEYRTKLRAAVAQIKSRLIQKQSENKTRTAENTGKIRQNCVFFRWSDVQYAIIQMPDLQFGLCVDSIRGFRMFHKEASLGQLLMPGKYMNINMECEGWISRGFCAAAMDAWLRENGECDGDGGVGCESDGEGVE